MGYLCLLDDEVVAFVVVLLMMVLVVLLLLARRRRRRRRRMIYSSGTTSSDKPRSSLLSLRIPRQVSWTRFKQQACLVRLSSPLPPDRLHEDTQCTIFAPIMPLVAEAMDRITPCHPAS